jgi:Flp pilus assembly protein TadG
MRITSLLTGLARRVRAWRDAEDGNVAIIFTIALLPIIGLTGGAIDYSRASSVKTAMQAALDATALAMSKEAASLTATELNQKASAYFAAAFNRPEAQSIRISASYSTTNGASVTVTGSGSIDTTFMGVMGIDSIPIESYAKTAWGSGKLRVALVLDNSGSMAEAGKMTALKTATKNLLATLQGAAATPGDVQVAIVPFNNYVNAGPGNYTANWIDWDDWEDDNGHDTSTTTCSTKKTGKSGRKKKRCETTTTWVPDNHNTWNGCVTDRDQPYDVQNTAPDPSKPHTLFPAEEADPCPTSILPMGYNWSTLTNKVNAMISDGNTNQPIGLAWGWHALSQGAPLSAPAITDNNTQNFIILLSDGENTENRWDDGWGAEAKINARQKLVCDNIKAAGVQIYSVLLVEGNESVMKDCASKSDMFFKLNSSNQVVSAFSAIGTKLAKLRLTR